MVRSSFILLLGRVRMGHLWYVGQVGSGQENWTYCGLIYKETERTRRQE